MGSLLDEIYQEIILDHYKNPRCRGCLDCPHRESCVFNPLCGDRVSINLDIIDGKVSQIVFDGEGCAISQASASIMCDLLKGKTVEEIPGLKQNFIELISGKTDAELTHIDEDLLGDASVLKGVRQFPARVRCAALAWEALGQCLKPEVLPN